MFSAIAFGLLTATALASPLIPRQSGYVEFENGTPYTIYWELVDASGVLSTDFALPGEGHYIPFGQQISVKMDLQSPIGLHPYQFEFNLDVDTGMVWYDWSAVDGDPFSGFTRTITPSDSSCTTVTCSEGDTSNDCQSTEPTNFNPLQCSGDAILTVLIS